MLRFALPRCLLCAGLFGLNPYLLAENQPVPVGAPPGWHPVAPRAEISPRFSFENKGGADGHGCLVLRSDGRAGEDGGWVRVFSVTGGKTYRFSALYQAKSVPVPRRSI